MIFGPKYSWKFFWPAAIPPVLGYLLVVSLESHWVRPRHAVIAFVTVLVSVYGLHLYNFFRRVRAEDEVRAFEARSKYLSEVSNVLSQTVSYDERLKKIAELMVPRLADGCMVFALGTEDLELKAISHTDAEKLRILKKIIQEFSLAPQGGVRRVFETGKPELFVTVDEKTLRDLSKSKEHLELFHQLNPTSILRQPLTARGRTIGVLTLFMTGSRHFTQEEAEFAEIMATRVALVADNARLYQEARQAVADRESVLGLIAHDFRNPLGLISNSMELMREICGPPEHNPQLEKIFAMVHRATKQMLRLSTDLVDFSKMRAGTFSLDRVPTSIGLVAEEASQYWSSICSSKGIKFDNRVARDLPMVVGDADRLHQVLNNLFSNAVKFTPKGGVIGFSAARRNGEVTLAISDTGVGIEPERLEKVFDRFWQADESKNLGSGLGLFIARNLVEAHGGRIWAENAPGGGARFAFSLPVFNRERVAMAF